MLTKMRNLKIENIVQAAYATTVPIGLLLKV